jgi:hypothetical protein
MKYNPSLLPLNQNENDLTIAEFLNNSWQIIENSSINTTRHVVTVSITHFSSFTILIKAKQSNLHFIENSRGLKWPPIGENIQKAIDNLNGPGEVWLPESTMEVYKKIYISKSGIKIHGQGMDKTIIVFHHSGIISSQNPFSNVDTIRFKRGVDDIQLDNFKFTGNGQFEMTLGNNTRLYNIKGENITRGPGAFRFVIPSGTKYANGLIVINCHTYKTVSHGFFINTLEAGCTIENVTYSGCSARFAGWPFAAGSRWSVGFDMCEHYGDAEYGDMTIKNVLVKNCVSDNNWESGFHFESRPHKINVTLDHCLAQNNGQKRFYYNESYVYCSGFMGLNDDITLINCIANNNTHFGFFCSSYRGFPPSRLINCNGFDNRDGLFKSCDTDR